MPPSAYMAAISASTLQQRRPKMKSHKPAKTWKETKPSTGKSSGSAKPMVAKPSGGCH